LYSERRHLSISLPKPPLPTKQADNPGSWSFSRFATADVAPLVGDFCNEICQCLRAQRRSCPKWVREQPHFNDSTPLPIGTAILRDSNCLVEQRCVAIIKVFSPLLDHLVTER
jgi:hypothetical protein